MNEILFKILIFCHRLVRGTANRVLDKNKIRPRNFSNAMLKKYASFFSGDMINVSGWRDEDGEGGHYRDYFSNADRYVVSNMGGQKKGYGSAGGAYEEIELDLTKPVPDNLRGAFDVVFNHTTLEHVYDFKEAFNALCALSRDVVIMVVPVLQQIHHTDDFGDYWRPTTFTIAKMFRENGFEPLVLECNDQPFAPVYCFAIASKNQNNYSEIAKKINFQMGAHNYGSSLNAESLTNLLG